MKNLVTISLVFFSLSHLAKIDRADTMRYMVQRNSDKHNITIEQISSNTDIQDLQDFTHLFLTNNQLSAIGVRPQKNCNRFRLKNQVSTYAVTLEHPRNNSP